MLLALCRGLIALGRGVAPAAFRDDWAREWRAELWHAAEARAGRPPSRREDLTLLFRCSGALVHAFWLRKEEWTPAVLWHDLRGAVRVLRHDLSFSAVAILTLALGIGAVTAVFSVVYGVLLDPLPYHEPGRLVQIWETNPLRNWTNATVAPANFLDWRARNRSFTDMAYYLGFDGKGPGLEDATLTGTGEPERIRGMAVSGNFFSVLGTPAVLGRALTREDSARGRTRVVVLSHGFFERGFGRDRAVVGQGITLDGERYEVVGVMPRSFAVPGGPADYWMPHLYDEARFRQMRRPHWFRVVARLRPGVTIARAREEMTRIAIDLEREYPDTNTQMGVGLGPLHDWFVGDVRATLLALLGAVGVVLLVACINVAGLLLGRASGRRREMAIRVAMGAGRIRLARQLLTESLILAVIAAAGGVLLARAALVLLRQLDASRVPRLDDVAIDGPVLLFSLGAAVVTALVFGFAPAWQAARTGPGEALKESGRSATGGGARRRRGLIVAEVALSVLLLITAGLLIRSVARLRAIDPGIDASSALTFRITLPPQRYETDDRIAAFYSALMERLRDIPGVRAAGASVRLTLEGRSWTGDLFVEGQPEVWGRELRHKSVTPGYLSAAGLRLLGGRDFVPSDTASSTPVVLVNQTLARRYFGDQDPVGRRLAFRQPAPGTVWRTIVGVVADEKQDGLASEVAPEVFEPHTQDTRSVMSVVVRTLSDPLGVVPAVKRELGALDPAVAIYDLRTLEEVVDRSLAEERFVMLALGAFASMALVLAMVGLYAVIAHGVVDRRREIGVRLALGAEPADVIRMVVGEGAGLVAAGLLAGIAGSLALGGLLAAFLHGAPAADPAVLFAVASVLGLSGLLASYIPALRASRVDPGISLRAE